MTKMNSKGVSVVLGSLNRIPFLKLTIKSIREELKNAPFPYEIIVIDGGSTDGTLPWLLKQKDIITIIQHNKGKWKGKSIERKTWGYFINLGFKTARGKYVCMLSDDCLIVPGAIRHGYHQFESALRNRDKVGAIAFYWRNWPKQREYHLLKYWNIINVNHGLYLTDALRRVEFADEMTYQFYWGDVDITFKLASNNYTIMAAENSYIEHFSHANTSQRKINNKSMESDRAKFLKKWSFVDASINSDMNDDVMPISRSFKDSSNTIKQWFTKPTILIILFWRYLIGKVPKLITKNLSQMILN